MVPEAEASPSEPNEPNKPNDAIGSNRGVETLFRTAYNTHLTLHSMADNKSRMMIQVNGLILSVLIAANSRLTGDLGPLDLSLAAIALLAAGSASMLLAVIAARPRSRRSNPMSGRAQSESGSLLFFSEFSGMSREEYVESMNELMRKPAALYDCMSGNLHTIGQLLERKYRYLRLSYSALAIGIVAACVAQLRLASLVG